MNCSASPRPRARRCSRPPTNTRAKISNSGKRRPKMGVIWYKIWFDLWHNKTRTLLAVLSIAAGVFAVGTIFGMSDMLLTNMDASHRAVLHTHLYVYLNQVVDRDTILNLRKIKGVEDIEPFNSINIVYK